MTPPDRTADAAFVVDAIDHERATLDLAMAPMTPPAGLWARIDTALAAAAGPASDMPITVELFQDGRWRDLAPGVRYKRLWDRKVMLLECQPGAFVPEHEHPSFEHAVVLKGDLVSDLGTFYAGDYHGLPVGGVHRAWTTTTGCLVLIQYAA